MRIRNRPCEGWYEQHGRHPMHHIRLSIDDGHITGTGEDRNGPFLFDGIVTRDQVVRMEKQYVGRHSVDYHGRFDGHRYLYGEWWLGEFTGAWEITLLDADGMATDTVAHSEADIATEADD